MSVDIRTLIESYDSFIIDLWGVIHDGHKTYSGVISTLALMRDMKKQVIFLSNAPRRAQKAAMVLERVEIGKDLYHQIITSGEAFFQQYQNYGLKYYYIGPKRDSDITLGSKMIETSAEMADIVLVTGFHDEDQRLEDRMVEIKTAHNHKLPMICANPDLMVVKQTGEIFPCAGMIAEYYQNLGNKVEYFGKPYKMVYEACLETIGNGKKILAIGDNLETDIKGANNMNIDSLLITGGIYNHLTNQEINELSDRHLAYPNFILNAFGIYP